MTSSHDGVHGVRLVALDLDGSVMRSDKSVSRRTRAAITSVLAEGIKVVPATGRGLWRLCEDVIGVSEIRYVISANGAMVTDRRKGVRLRERLITSDLASDVLGSLMRPGVVAYVHLNDSHDTHILGCVSADEARRVASNRHWHAYVRSDLVDYVRTDGRGVAKIGIVSAEPLTLQSIEDHVACHYPELVSYRVDDETTEIGHKGANKGEALSFLCARLHVPLSSVCAIGDSDNDVDMVAVAGVGVAMGNATDRVRHVADAVTLSNDDDGVAVFLEHSLLGVREG